ncbi:MAG: nucleotide-binding protein [Methanomicrobiales archaeon]|nr:nucleotide-binding protein [Methanomicrobiales archaeon]MDI6876706.1 nucleotide-binding protein [Methanomicrobiales archaeon]
MTVVLDASAFFRDLPPSGEARVTAPSVVGEIRDIGSRLRLERMLAEGLQVRDPSPAALAAVADAAVRSGDAGVLSPPDRDILALALETGGVLCTDDFAVQNVARTLGVAVRPIQQRAARHLRWRFRCTGCGRYFREEGVCPICGSVLKRKVK